MQLLNNPMPQDEMREMLRFLDGNICRVCTSEDVEEIVCQLGFAVDRLSTIAYSRVKLLQKADWVIGGNEP